MSIPEFLLRSLYVKGSLRREEDWFSFSLLNRVAPVSINSFVLELDGKSLPPSEIEIAGEKSERKCADSMSTSSVYTLPVHEMVTVFVRAGFGKGSIRISIDSVEAGELSFGLELGKEGGEMGKPTAAYPAPGEATLRPAPLDSLKRTFGIPFIVRASIDPEKSYGKIDPRVYGHFVEHLERCVYGGLFTPEGKPNEATVRVVKELRPPLIRYPGGNFASGYHWKDGIGPQGSRPARTDEAWRAVETNRVGTDEFLRLCEGLGAEACICVNDATGSAGEAADWVEYCNGRPETPYGAKRKGNGRERPYGVKLWGLGNEAWGRWQIGAIDALGYARRALPIIREMRNKDPDIKIVAVGDMGRIGSGPEDPDHPGVAWNEVVLKNLGNEINYLSFHIYQPDRGGWRESYDPESLWKTVCAAPLTIERIVRDIGAQIGRWTPGKNIGVALDEWNLWLAPPSEAGSMHAVRYTLRDALYAASVLNSFHRVSGILKMANLAQLVNVLPLIVSEGGSAWATAIYWPFVLYREMVGLALEVSSDCPAFNSEELGTIEAAKNVPWVDMSASWEPETGKLIVSAVNRHPYCPCLFELDLSKFPRLRKVRERVLSGTGLLAVNDSSDPDRVGIREGKELMLEKSRLTGKIPQASVVVAEFQT